jgi:ABC-type lipoprotein release transport system permease subunit
MKTIDLIWIAAKNFKGRWMALPGLGLAISVFCLCFAGTVLVTVQQEKSQPYALAISAAGNQSISDSMMAQIAKLPNVTAATPLLQVSARVKTGIYSAQLTLTGIAPSYLNTAFAKGSVFPSSGDMPYIVLNAAASKHFSNNTANTDTGTGADTGSGNTAGSDGGTKTGIGSDTGNGADTGSDSTTGSDAGTQTGNGTDTGNANTDTGTDTGSGNITGSDAGAKTDTGTQNDTDSNTNINADSGTDANADAGNAADDNTNAPKIDWLNASYSLQTGGSEQWIPSKVCGMIAGSDKGQEPDAYVSLSAAKNLLQRSGQSTNYTGAKVRVTNIGYTDSVSQAIAALGLNVTNSNAALQTKWDGEFKEMTYLIVIGAFCLLCSAVLLAVWRKISLQEQKEAWETLRWLGIKEKIIRSLFLAQAIMISLIGIAVGIIVALSLPSYLPPDLKGKSIYTLPIPFEVILLSIVICIIAAVCSCFKNQSRIPSD